MRGLRAGCRHAVGVDIGGTNTVWGIVDARGNIVARDGMRTEDYADAGLYADALAGRIGRMIDVTVSREDICGIGVGAPNANFYTGAIEHAPNLPWRGRVPMAGMLERRMGLPVVMSNDADAAALGEMRYGAAKGMRDFIMITLGTGVGGGIVTGGRLVHGHDGLAGELGHVIVERGGRLCGCGRRGCLETYCSATGVVRTAREFLSGSDEPSLLRRKPADGITSEDIFDAAEDGDEPARRIFDYTGSVLGRALADFIVFSGPEAIVLSGGLSRAGHYITEPARRAMEENVMPVFKGRTRLLLSGLGDPDAAVLGAASLVWEAG